MIIFSDLFIDFRRLLCHAAADAASCRRHACCCFDDTRRYDLPLLRHDVTSVTLRAARDAMPRRHLLPITRCCRVTIYAFMDTPLRHDDDALLMLIRAAYLIRCRYFHDAALFRAPLMP